MTFSPHDVTLSPLRFPGRLRYAYLFFSFFLPFRLQALICLVLTLLSFFRGTVDFDRNKWTKHFSLCRTVSTKPLVNHPRNAAKARSTPRAAIALSSFRHSPLLPLFRHDLAHLCLRGKVDIPCLMKAFRSYEPTDESITGSLITTTCQPFVDRYSLK